jgi:hypothetical protein
VERESALSGCPTRACHHRGRRYASSPSTHELRSGHFDFDFCLASCFCTADPHGVHLSTVRSSYYHLPYHVVRPRRKWHRRHRNVTM